VIVLVGLAALLFGLLLMAASFVAAWVWEGRFWLPRMFFRGLLIAILAAAALSS
jgi:hypothetical protein